MGKKFTGIEINPYQTMKLNLNKILPDYKLIDCGNGLKLEKFGQITLIRPDISAKQPPALSIKKWLELADAEFISDDKRVKGRWKKLKPIPESWELKVQTKFGIIKSILKLTNTKHIGVFPEQAFNIEFIEKQNEGNILNLFAYTGLISIVSAKAGNSVTHIDSVKKINMWGKQSMFNSKANNIRWITEDAQDFVKREIRRKNKYSGIILDPPAIGKGPTGQTWIFEKSFESLLQNIIKIIDEKSFIIINLYMSEISHKFAHKIVLEYFPNHKINFCDNIYGLSSHGNTVNHGFLIRLES